MWTLFNKKHFTIDLLFKPNVFSLGIDFGYNKIRSGQIENLFLDLSFAFWTLGFELKR